MHIQKVINRRKRAVKEVSPCKEKIPHTPLRETDSLQEISQVYCSCLSPARARRRVHPKREVAAAVEDALVAFHGTRRHQADAQGYCDERLWAAICWRIGTGNFLEAIYCCQRELDLRRRPLPHRDCPRYFQAYLTRRFGKGGAK